MPVRLTISATPQQVDAIEAELAALEDDFDADSYVTARRAFGGPMTPDAIEADLGATVVYGLARALVRSGADSDVALRLARHHAGPLIEHLTAEADRAARRNNASDM